MVNRYSILACLTLLLCACTAGELVLSKAAPTPPDLPSVNPTSLTITPVEPVTHFVALANAPRKLIDMRSGPGLEFSVIQSIPAWSTDIASGGALQNINGVTWALVAFKGVSGWVERADLAVQSEAPIPGVSAVAGQVIQALQERDFQALAALVHPQSGLRFSPYTTVRSEDLAFPQKEIANLWNEEQILKWGNYDGSGEPIELDFPAYYQRFVYDVDFARPEVIGFNTELSAGNTINNIVDFYPGAQVVEFHFSGFEAEYEGLDWRSLRLVFLPYEGDWRLAGLVHDQWGP